VEAALSGILSQRALLNRTSGGHAAVDAGLYASGPRCDRFHGSLDNTEIAHLLAGLMNVTRSVAAHPSAATSSR
jgi:alkaline phosphatase